MIIKTGKVDSLTYKVYDSRGSMGAAAANEAVEYIKRLLTTQSEVNIVFAAAPSQNEMLAGLLDSDLDFSRINAFHMDEYIGLTANAPQAFGAFLDTAIFSKVKFKSINKINPAASDIDAECERYTALLNQMPIDVVCMGIGENGHIAFNDPGTGMADFNDPKTVKKVLLDEVCRMQQVNDGCFDSIDAVPKYALTLTVPALFAGKRIFCVVPAKTKADAVRDTLYGAISEDCPASILRNHAAATLYCDVDSGKYIN